MNTFFYSTQKPDCEADCSFQACPEKYLYQLRKIPALASMKAVPHGSVFPPPMETELRSGDLVILRAGSKDELERLVMNKEAFEQYRIIMIIDKDVYDGNRSYYLLGPRFITTAEHGFGELNEVILKLIEQAKMPYQGAQMSAKGASHASTR